MKVLMVLFSQTGGTEKIGKSIQKGIIKSGNACEIVEIKKAKNQIFDDYDLIGIGTPTFFYREPYNVKHFIHHMDEGNGKHCFMFCTHGSIIGNTFYFMWEGLTKQGYTVIDSFDCYSESSIQFYPDIMHTAHHPDDLEIKEAGEFGEQVCSKSSKVQNGEVNLIPEYKLIDDRWWSRESKNISLDVLRKISPQFKINEEKCSKCYICQEKCPVDAIDVDAEPPQIQKEGCISCWFCEKICPENAIEADWSFIKKSSRGNLKKYIEALKEGERQGKFRPYVDYEKIE